jgi:hypothetical protein
MDHNNIELGIQTILTAIKIRPVSIALLKRAAPHLETDIGLKELNNKLLEILSNDFDVTEKLQKITEFKKYNLKDLNTRFEEYETHIKKLNVQILNVQNVQKLNVQKLHKDLKTELKKLNLEKLNLENLQKLHKDLKTELDKFINLIKDTLYIDKKIREIYPNHMMPSITHDRERLLRPHTAPAPSIKKTISPNAVVFNKSRTAPAPSIKKTLSPNDAVVRNKSRTAPAPSIGEKKVALMLLKKSLARTVEASKISSPKQKVAYKTV